MNYEQYHQKGGTYVIPVEVFDDLLDEKEDLDKEKQELIDYLKERQLFYYKQYKYSTQQEDLKMYNRLVNEYDKILSKIEKSDK